MTNRPPQKSAELQTPASPLVSVYCMTYNHVKTIAQAIESIVSQKTDFPFELIVHDDASTDGTADIVREYAQRYPKLIRPIIQTENQYHKCNLIREFIHPISKGKFIALCEGDDFWTDADKLQLQADYMRSHPDCTFSFHAVQQLSPNGDRMTCRPLKKSREVPASLIIKRGGLFCSTVSTMFRRDVMGCWPDFREAADVYDYPLQILAAVKGQAYYMDRIMGVYRFASTGSWTEKHAQTTDFGHIKNETAWLELFNTYTDGKYQASVDYHMAHMWFTEYRKTLAPSIRKNAMEYIRRLSFSERLPFLVFLAAFSVCGRPANKLFGLLKKYLLK